MPTTVTVAEIADLIGVENAIIKRTIERRDDDLQPYLHEDPETSAQDQTVTDAPVSDPATPLLDLEGLPLLITKLSFNIPTLDIIENLAARCCISQSCEKKRQTSRPKTRNFKVKMRSCKRVSTICSIRLRNFKGN